MADESTYSDQERSDLVDRILDNGDHVPSEMRERYVGPKEASLSSARGVIFGSIGGSIGYYLGRITEANPLNDPAAIKGKNRRVFAIVGGVIGAAMGLFSGSTEAREGARQVRRMQRRIEDLHGQTQVLKDEVRAQKNQERGEEAEEAEQPKASKQQEVDIVSADKAEDAEKPETILDAKHVVEHEVAEESLAVSR